MGITIILQCLLQFTKCTNIFLSTTIFFLLKKKKKSKLYLFILKKKTTFIGCDLVKD